MSCHVWYVMVYLCACTVWRERSTPYTLCSEIVTDKWSSGKICMELQISIYIYFYI